LNPLFEVIQVTKV